MRGRIEDVLGKTAIVMVFALLAFQHLGSLLAIIARKDEIDFWPLVLSSRLVGLLFLFLVVGVTLFRLPPRQSAEGIEPRLSALAGTFALMLLIVLPTGSVGPVALAFATILMVVGSALSIYCLLWLGRSFSIMASARSLVTGGPYGLVRHPLYAAEAISIVGVIIAHWSLAALLLGAIQFAFQFRRMFNEERVLRRVFPEYAVYAAKVPMIVPRLAMVPARSAA